MSELHGLSTSSAYYPDELHMHLSLGKDGLLHDLSVKVASLLVNLE